MVEETYLKKIGELSKIKVLIIGQDPYPVGSNGIAFCKNSFDDLFKQEEEFRCSGQDVLYSLGFTEKAIRENFDSPIQLWDYLLERGVVMINIAHETLSDKFVSGQSTEAYNEHLFKSNLEIILKSKEINDPIIQKSDELFILGELKTKPVFDSFYSEFKDKPREVLVHPSSRNKTTNQKKITWNKVWGSKYLFERIKDKL